MIEIMYAQSTNMQRKMHFFLSSMATLCTLLCTVAWATTQATAQEDSTTEPTAIIQSIALGRPAVGAVETDFAFDTQFRRVSSASETGGFETQSYSQLQAISPDSQFLLLESPNGYVIRRLDTLQAITLNTAAWNAPRWYTPRDHTVIHYDSNDDAILRVQLTNVQTEQMETVFTFPAPFERIRTTQSFDELARDGRWMAGLASQNGGEQVIFALDLQNGVLGAQIPLPQLYNSACIPDPQWGNIEPDWIGVSPLGRYLVVQWPADGTERCHGLETFDLTTGAFVGRVYDGHQHGDLGVLPDGDTEFFMTFELYNPNANGNLSIGYRTLPGTPTVSEPVYIQVMDWHGAHISCQGPNGVCLVTTLGDAADGWSPLEGELFLQYTDGRVKRIMHHRSSSCGYWVQPRASLSQDGRYAIFASDWAQETGVNGCSEEVLGRGDPYLIDLSASGGEAANTPTATGTSQSTPTAPATSTPAAPTETSTPVPTSPVGADDKGVFFLAVAFNNGQPNGASPLPTETATAQQSATATATALPADTPQPTATDIVPGTQTPTATATVLPDTTTTGTATTIPTSTATVTTVPGGAPTATPIPNGTTTPTATSTSTATTISTATTTSTATVQPTAEPPNAIAVSLGYTLSQSIQADAVELRQLGVEAVFAASQLANTGQVVTTGTLIVNSSGTTTYNPQPTDRLHAQLADGQQLDFYTTTMQGDFTSTATNFLDNAHSYTARIVTDPAAAFVHSATRVNAPPNADVQIVSTRTGAGANSGDMSLSVVGRMSHAGNSYDVNLIAQGTWFFESSFGGLEQRQNYSVSGAINSAAGAPNTVTLTVNEQYANERIVSSGVSVSTADTAINNGWTFNGLSYSASNWLIRRSFRDGVPSQLDTYWQATGQLLENGQVIGQIGLDLSDGVYVKVVLQLADRTIVLQRFQL